VKRAIALALALCTLPLVALATGTVDEITYKSKDRDGNLWADRYRGGRLMRGHCARHRCIAFTFDDGPAFETTPRLLETLDARGLRVTFFVTGHRMDGDGEVARRNREVLRSAWQRGHLIGNHTYNHDLMDTMTEATLRFEIDRTEAAIGQLPPWEEPKDVASKKMALPKKQVGSGSYDSTMTAFEFELEAINLY
jgi:hypothetical protein